MGVFKKFIGGLAVESLGTCTNTIQEQTNNSVIPYKTTDGNKYQYLVVGQSSANDWGGSLIPYQSMVPVATADDISNYSLDDYQISAIGTTSYTKIQSIVANSASILYVITITSGDNDITVKCIKFSKSVMYDRVSSYKKNMLTCGYYLDEPLTIPAGESRTITIEMKVGTDVSVNES